MEDLMEQLKPGELPPIKRINLDTSSLIGEGSFGKVYKAILHSNGREVGTVAVKCMKAVGFNLTTAYGSQKEAFSFQRTTATEQRLCFIEEAVILSRLQHQNIVRIIGFCMDESTRMQVLEFMEEGSVDNYLINNRGKLDEETLICILTQVATGCKYLHEEGYIHRDLASRNVLCRKQKGVLICKLCDFGLSKDVSVCGKYKMDHSDARAKPFPPELQLLEDLEFHGNTYYYFATDVWYFGIVIWDVYQSYFSTWSREEIDSVLHRNDGAKSLPSEVVHKKQMKHIMKLCLEQEPESRPDFHIICDELK